MRNFVEKSPEIVYNILMSNVSEIDPNRFCRFLINIFGKGVEKWQVK